jgi:lysophospholipase L1-like esterase
MALAKSFGIARGWPMGGGQVGGGTPTPTPTPVVPPLDASVSNLTFANTAKTRAAMQRVRNNTGSMKMIAPGDSTFAAGLTTANGQDRLFAAPFKMSSYLQSDGGLRAICDANMGAAGAGGTLNSTPAQYRTYNALAALTGSIAFGSGDTIAGRMIGAAAVPSGYSTTSNGPVTAFRLVYSRNNAAGVFAYSIDGGAETQIDRFSATSDVQEIIIPAPAGPAAVHTLTLRHVSGFCAWPLVECMDLNAPNYIRTLNAGWSSSSAQHWNVATDPWHPRSMLQREAANADLVIFNLGINNWRGDTNGTLGAAYNTNMSALITAAKAGGADVILLKPFPSALTDTSQARQDVYRAQIDNLAATFNLPIIDLQAYYVSNAQAQADGWGISDGVHCTTAGYDRTGRLLSNTLRYIEAMTA